MVISFGTSYFVVSFSAKSTTIVPDSIRMALSFVLAIPWWNFCLSSLRVQWQEQLKIIFIILSFLVFWANSWNLDRLDSLD